MLCVSQPAFDKHVSMGHRVLPPAACAGRCGALSSCAAATPVSATAAPRLSPRHAAYFRALSVALLPLQLLRLGTLLLILTHHWAMLRCFRLFSNFEISFIFRF